MQISREHRSLYRIFGIVSVAALTWLIWNLRNPGNDLPGCLFRHVTGIPCPSCGITHSVMDICNFRFAEAVQSNILGFPATAMLAIVPLLIVTDVTFRKQNFITCYRRMETFLHKNQLLAAMLAVLILVNWIYLILQN